MGLLRRLFSGTDRGTTRRAAASTPASAASGVDAAAVADVLAARLENAGAIIAAADRADVPVAVAAALAELESGGRNVFGNDRGGVFSTPGAPDLEVTGERVAELRRRVAAGETSNGIGPAQITWPPFFDRADEEGLDLTDPEDNIVLGLTILREHAGRDFSRAGLERAGTLYNAGTLKNGVTGYGRRLARAAEAWQERLGGQGTVPDATRGTATERDAVGPRPAGGDASEPEHVVEPGDTLWAIAREHGTEVASLRRLNPDIVPEEMAVGTRVRLPRR